MQLSYLIWRSTTLGYSFDWLILTSLLTSLVQLSHTYHYTKELSRAYRKSFLGILRELLLLTSRKYVPYRLVLRSWATVDFLPVRTELADEWWTQISDALLGNQRLRHLRFSAHHVGVDASGLAAICPALRVNRHLRELSLRDEEVHSWAFEEKQAEKEQAAAPTLPTLPSAVIDVLSAPTGLRVVRIEGLQISPSQWLSIFEAVAAVAHLEALHLSTREPLRLKLAPAQLTQLRTEGTRALLSVRSLRVLSLRRVPSSVLDALLEGGLQRSHSITSVGSACSRPYQSYTRSPSHAQSPHLCRGPSASPAQAVPIPMRAGRLVVQHD